MSSFLDIKIERPLPTCQKVNFPFTLAPMVGLSHIALRQLIREYTPKEFQTIWPTEMLSSRRLSVQNPGQTPETLSYEHETDLVPQILGNDERFIQKACEKLESWGVVGIDINMGCPVKKALKHNYGVALMGDPDYASNVVRMTVRNTNLPVSVKFRAGLQKDDEKLKVFVEKIQAAGASWVCLHPRTAEQKRKGQSDWTQILALRNYTDLPIIGNGDIQNWQDALNMKEQTNCDMVMIGRAMTARPWLFWQLGHALGMPNSSTLPPLTPEEEAKEYGRALIRFIELCEENFTPDMAKRKIRFFIKVSHPWLNFGHRLNGMAHKSENFEQLKEQVRKFFAKDGHIMSSYTELRY